MTIKLELSKTAQKIFIELKEKYLDNLESKRFRYMKRFNSRRKLTWRVNLPILLIAVVFDIYLHGLQPTIAIYAVVPLVLMLYVNTPYYNFRRSYKRHFIKKFMPEFFNKTFGYNYTGQKDMLEYKLENFKLLGNFHTYFGEDYLSGTINKKIKMEFEEVEVIDDLNNFKGAAILLEMPSPVKKRIIIKSKAVFRNSKQLDNGLQKASVEDNSFAKYFEVLCKDKAYVESIITNKLMKKIIETSKKLHDLFNEEFLVISPQYNHNIKGYNSTVDHKMSTATLEIEMVGNKVLLLLRGQYDFLATANLDSSVYCEKRLSVIEQEFKAIESIAKIIEKGE